MIGQNIGVEDWRAINAMLASTQIASLRTPVHPGSERRVYCDESSVAGELFVVGENLYAWYVKNVDTRDKFFGRPIDTGQGELYFAIAEMFAALTNVHCHRTANRLQRERRLAEKYAREEDGTVVTR